MFYLVVEVIITVIIFWSFDKPLTETSAFISLFFTLAHILHTTGERKLILIKNNIYSKRQIILSRVFKELLQFLP